MDRENRPDIGQDSLALHAAHCGKLEIRSKVPLSNRDDLSMAYTPGVAEVCREIAHNPEAVWKYTLKSNTIAIISDGTAVLGLGNIGPLAGIPVMEGKAILFKEFAGVDAFPICLEAKSEDLVRIIRSLAPVFGGINLEDIAAPACFEIEEELQDLGIPVMHDDQHGAAVAVLAAIINACKVTGKRFEDLRVVVCGAGAAGYAICRLLKCIGYDTKSCTPVKELIACDTSGIIYRGRPGLYENKYKFILGDETNSLQRIGSLTDAMKGADVFVGVSVANLVTEEMIRAMGSDPIVLSLANPVPEIMPDKAKAAGAVVVGTGRSDYPNQVNNVLVFPGIFRGALDARATRITDEMKIAAAHAIADCVPNQTSEKILPDPLDRGVVTAVAEAVKQAAITGGVARNS